MARGAREIAKEVVEAWNSGDLRPVYELFDPEIVIRPDPYLPDSAAVLAPIAGRAFWESNRASLGGGRVDIVAERPAGDRCLTECVQQVDGPASGVAGSFEWSFITTIANERIAAVEFFLDRDRGRRALAEGTQPS